MNQPTEIEEKAFEAGNVAFRKCPGAKHVSRKSLLVFLEAYEQEKAAIRADRGL